jgi:hypothetical protein
MKMEIQMLVFGRKSSPILSRARNWNLTSRAGISIGLIDDIPTCQNLVARIVREAEAEINRMSGLMQIAGADEAWERSQRTREAKL